MLKDFDKRDVLILIILLMLYGTLFLFSTTSGQIYLKDSYEYLSQVENLRLHGNWYAGEWSDKPLNTARFSKRPPGYALFILIVQLTGSGNLIVSFFQGLLAILNIFLVFRLLKQFSLENHWWLLIIAVVFFPAQLIYSQMIMAEMLFQTLVLAAFWFMVQFLVFHAHWKNLLWYHLFIAATVVVKPVMLYFWIFNIVFLLFLVWRRKLNWKLLPQAIIPVLPILLVSWFNLQQTGYFHYSSMKSINLLQYNAKFALYGAEGPEAGQEQINEIEEKAETIEDFGQKQEYIQSAATEQVMSHLPAYIKIHLKGMVNMLLDPGRFDIVNYFKPERRGAPGMLYYFGRYGYKGIFEMARNMPPWLIMMLILVMVWNVTLLTAGFIFLMNKQVSLEVRIFLLLLVGYIVFMTGPVGAARYKVAIYPEMLFALCFAYDWIKTKASRRKVTPAYT